MTDAQKWAGPANGGEVARGLLRARQALNQLFVMIHAAKYGDNSAFDKASEMFVDFDGQLKDLIDEIGGLK